MSFQYRDNHKTQSWKLIEEVFGMVRKHLWKITWVKREGSP